MKIKLGKLPDETPIKITISVSSVLKARLELYAHLYSQTWQQEANASALIPHMLSQYLAHDRAFRKLERSNPAVPTMSDPRRSVAG